MAGGRFLPLGIRQPTPGIGSAHVQHRIEQALLPESWRVRAFGLYWRRVARARAAGAGTVEQDAMEREAFQSAQLESPIPSEPVVG